MLSTSLSKKGTSYRQNVFVFRENQLRILSWGGKRCAIIQREKNCGFFENYVRKNKQKACEVFSNITSTEYSHQIALIKPKLCALPSLKAL